MTIPTRVRNLGRRPDAHPKERPKFQSSVWILEKSGCPENHRSGILSQVRIPKKPTRCPLYLVVKKKTYFIVYHNYIKNNRVLLEYRIEVYYKLNNIYKYKIQYHESKFLKQLIASNKK